MLAATEVPLGKITAIELPPDGTYRSRKIVSRSRGRPTGKYPSWKMKRMIHWESPYERIAFRLLDATPSVLSYCEQPLKIHYELNGEPKVHYPDLLVKTAEATKLWEIKPAHYAVDEQVLERTALLAQCLLEYGYLYQLVPAEELANPSETANALTLLKFGWNDIPIQERERLRLLIEQVPYVTWSSVLDGALGPLGRNHICRLVLEGALTFDMSVPLGRETVIAKVKATKPDY